MVCDLFVDAYRAGQSCGDLAYNAARGTRARLIKELGEVYAELESESYHREQFEVELKQTIEERDRLKEEIERRIEEKKAIFNGTPCPGMKTRLSEIYGSKLTDPDNPDSPLWSDFEPTEDDIPDDAVKFSEQDLPFPEVDLDERIKAQKSADISVDNLHFIQDLNRQEREKGGDE